MFTNSRGYPEVANVNRQPRSTYVRRFLIQARNVSSFSGHPHCQRQSRSSHQLMPFGLILIWNLLPQTAACMRSSVLPTETCMRKWWSLQGMLTNGPWWQPQSLKKIERMSHSISQQCSNSNWWHSSHWHRRSSGCWGDPQATSCHGEPETRPEIHRQTPARG